MAIFRESFWEFHQPIPFPLVGFFFTFFSSLACPGELFPSAASSGFSFPGKRNTPFLFSSLVRGCLNHKKPCGGNPAILVPKHLRPCGFVPLPFDRFTLIATFFFNSPSIITVIGWKENSNISSIILPPTSICKFTGKGPEVSSGPANCSVGKRKRPGGRFPQGKL